MTTSLREGKLWIHNTHLCVCVCVWERFGNSINWHMIINNPLLNWYKFPLIYLSIRELINVTALIFMSVQRAKSSNLRNGSVHRKCWS